MLQQTELQKLLNKIEDRTQHLDLYVDTMVSYTRNAILVPLVMVDNELCLLFEVRALHLKWQPGEICFPGGRIEKTDTNFAMTAMRETYEELGIPTDNIVLFGALSPVISPIGAEIYPYLGFIKDLSVLNINPDEVDHIFTVPVSFLLQAEPSIGESETATRTTDKFPHELINATYPAQWRVRNIYKVYFYQYQKYVIWGLTAHIMRNFLANYKDLLCK